MKYFFLILLLAIQVNLFAQQVKPIGEEDYYNCKTYKIDSLIQVYQKRNQKDSVQKILERAIQCPLQTYYQLRFYSQLADIYYQQGRYSESLRLINLEHSLRFHVQTPHNPYPLVANFAFALQQAKCYEALRDTTDFIETLTPFVFYKLTAFDNWYDTASYEKIYNHYLDILLTKHSVVQVKKELNKANTSFYYYDSTDKETNQFGFVYHKIDCGFLFFNNHIIYSNTSVYTKPGEAVPDYLSKEYQCKYFKEAPLYKKIKSM